MASQHQASLKGYERHAWIILILGGVLMLAGSLLHLISGEPVSAGLAFMRGNLGMTWDQLVVERPEVAAMIAGYLRVMAVFVVAFSVLFIAVVATAYRRGERWAWFAAWSYPAVLLGSAAIAAIHRGWAGDLDWAGPAGIIFLIPILLGLLLPVRVFFSKPGQSAGRPGGRERGPR